MTKPKHCNVLVGTVWFLMLTVLSFVPICEAQTPASTDAEVTSTRILADGLDDSESQILERFAARLESYRKQLNIPGMSAAVIKDQQLVWAEGFGFADLENKVLATPRTPYHLASLTKTFASQVIMRLVQEGKIKLDDPVKKYGVKIRNDPGITVRHLFTHTSEGRPGNDYKYNGSRFGFLGKVIENACGKSFRELVVTQILKPTAMLDTAPELPRSAVKDFRQDSPLEDIEENFKRVNKQLAKPYALNDSFEVVPNDYPNPDHFGVSTGLISTVIDMAKYDRAIDNHAFITAESQELAFTPTVSNRRDTLPYGLGWFVQSFAGTKLLWHYGWEVSYSALIVKVPEEHVTFVVFANTDYLSRPFDLGSGDVLNSPLAVEFLKTVAFRDRFAESVPDIAWDSQAAAIISQFAKVKDAELKELLKRELMSNLMLNHHMKREQDTRRLMDVHIRVFTRDEFESFPDQPIIATIDNVGDGEYRIVGFELEKDTAVRVYSIGEATRGFMFDYGGIENAQTGQLIWEMYGILTEHAGGAPKNRKVDRILPLPTGMYRLHYRSDESHSFDNWNALPPDHYWWGIRLFDASASRDHANVQSWERAAAPEELGWSSERLQALESDLERLKTDALMIVTDGKVAYEWGKTTNNIYSHSTRKSLLSALYGTYVAEGKIDTSLTMEELGITEHVALTEDERKARVIDLLKARSGVYIPAAAEVKSMRDARPKRGDHKPGMNWYYNNWDFNVLGTIFRQETGEDIYGAFKQRIAEPIGMQDYVWEKQRYSYEQNFSIHPAYPFLISARDMARLGQLFLQNGRWGDTQVISADWVAESTRAYSETNRSAVGYGYMWWIVTDDFCGMKEGDYYASGYGGQKLFVLPRINTVVVHRVNIYNAGIDVGVTSSAPFQLMPKIMKAYTGQKKKVLPVLAAEMMPQQHLLKDYAQIQAAIVAGVEAVLIGWRYAAWTWLLLVAGSAVVFMLDLAWGPRPSWPRRLIWVLGIVLLGPLGLLTYYYSYRRPSRSPDMQAAMTTWRHAVYAAVHSVAGYVVGVLVTVACFVFWWPNAHWTTILPVGYVAPLLIGLLIFRAPFVLRQLGGRYWLAVRRALSLEVISMNLVFAGFGPVFLFLRYRLFADSLEMISPFFLLTLSLAVAPGTLMLVLFNAWLCRRGLHSVLVQPAVTRDVADATKTRGPFLKDTWLVFVLSFILLLASICIAVLQIPS
ncbi:MAG: serine hydrolase [Phycisphaerales bacterium]|nr:MAG: serine hydrolase [Phycisphaerales bacterium]